MPFIHYASRYTVMKINKVRLLRLCDAIKNSINMMRGFMAPNVGQHNE